MLGAILGDIVGSVYEFVVGNKSCNGRSAVKAVFCGHPVKVRYGIKSAFGTRPFNNAVLGGFFKDHPSVLTVKLYNVSGLGFVLAVKLIT